MCVGKTVTIKFIIIMFEDDDSIDYDNGDAIIAT